MRGTGKNGHGPPLGDEVKGAPMEFSPREFAEPAVDLRYSPNKLHGDEIGGIAVHIAQRVQGLAQPDEVVASRTVADLVGGSGIPFADRGTHALKGVPDPWHLFAVEDSPL